MKKHTLISTLFLATLILFTPLAQAFPRTLRISGCTIERFRTTRAMTTYENAETNAQNFSGSSSDCRAAWSDYMNACEAYWNQYEDYQLECQSPDGTLVEQLTFEAEIQSEVDAEIDACAQEFANAIVNEC